MSCDKCINKNNCSIRNLTREEAFPIFLEINDRLAKNQITEKQFLEIKQAIFERME